MKGKKCGQCGFFTMFQLDGFLVCSECGLSVCDEWGEPCPYGLHGKVQETCLECWGERLRNASKESKNMSGKTYQYRGIVHQPEGDEDQPLGVSSE